MAGSRHARDAGLDQAERRARLRARLILNRYVIIPPLTP